jgi:hypothetical protein
LLGGDESAETQQSTGAAFGGDARKAAEQSRREGGGVEEGAWSQSGAQETWKLSRVSLGEDTAERVWGATLHSTWQASLDGAGADPLQVVLSSSHGGAPQLAEVVSADADRDNFVVRLPDGTEHSTRASRIQRISSMRLGTELGSAAHVQTPSSEGQARGAPPIGTPRTYAPAPAPAVELGGWVSAHHGQAASSPAVLGTSMRCEGVSLRYRLFTPELQWQPRGKRRLLLGNARGRIGTSKAAGQSTDADDDDDVWAELEFEHERKQVQLTFLSLKLTFLSLKLTLLSLKLTFLSLN